ncbi:MAG: hypothetical protein ABI920_13895 [Casimicrobiaceae bacterium]
MTQRRTAPPPNQKPDQRKNIHDPSEHPLGSSDSPSATVRRKDVTGDDNLRLPHEHDETADAEERTAGNDAVIQQAHRDIESDKVDTEVRSDAVKVFNRAPGKTKRGGR